MDQSVVWSIWTHLTYHNSHTTTPSSFSKNISPQHCHYFNTSFGTIDEWVTFETDFTTSNTVNICKEKKEKSCPISLVNVQMWEKTVSSYCMSTYNWWLKLDCATVHSVSAPEPHPAQSVQDNNCLMPYHGRLGHKPVFLSLSLSDYYLCLLLHTIMVHAEIDRGGPMTSYYCNISCLLYLKTDSHFISVFALWKKVIMKCYDRM